MDKHLIRARSGVRRFTRRTPDLLEKIGVRAEGAAATKTREIAFPGLDSAAHRRP
jgi:hypothetical protein